MKIKKILSIAICLTMLTITTANASFQKIKEKIFKDQFSYTEEIQPKEIEINGEKTICKIGELSGKDAQGKVFTSGYVVQATLNEKEKQKLVPYFKMNLTKEEWLKLSKFNEKILLCSENILTETAKEILAAQSKDNKTKEFFKNAKITTKDMEIGRKINSGKNYVYLVGSVMELYHKGIEFSMYTHVYIFLEKDELKMIMLITRSEGKNILLYAFDDIVLRMANGE